MRIDLDLNTIDELGDISDTVKLSRSLMKLLWKIERSQTCRIILK